MELTQEKIAELKQKHGDKLIAVDAPNGVTMVFRAPTKAVWSEFVDTVAKDNKSRSSSILKLVQSCVVYPSTTETAAVFDEFPALPASISGEVGKMAGQSDELDVKTLSGLRGDPLRAAFALLAFIDPNSDEDKRVDGALLVVMALNDLAHIRSVFFKLDGE